MVNKIKPRLCLQIAGQARNFEKAAPSLWELEKYFDVTTIISTWKKRGRKLDGPLPTSRLSRLMKPEDCAAIPQSWVGNRLSRFYLPELFRKLETSEELTKESFEGKYPNVEVCEIEEDFDFENFRVHAELDPNSIKMLYKYWKADLHRQTIEKRRNLQFDRIIRIRPDSPLNVNKLSTLDIERYDFVESLRQNHCQDTFAYGCRQFFEHLNTLFPRALTITGKEDWKTIHVEMFELVSYYNSSQKEVLSAYCCRTLVADSEISTQEILESIPNLQQGSNDHTHISLQRLIFKDYLGCRQQNKSFFEADIFLYEKYPNFLGDLNWFKNFPFVYSLTYQNNILFVFSVWSVLSFDRHEYVNGVFYEYIIKYLTTIGIPTEDDIEETISAIDTLKFFKVPIRAISMDVKTTLKNLKVFLTDLPNVYPNINRPELKNFFDRLGVM